MQECFVCCEQHITHQERINDVETDIKVQVCELCCDPELHDR